VTDQPDKPKSKVNENLATTFGTPAGRETLAWLRSITINAVCGPEVTDAQLRHREGMRFLVGIIEQRIEAHHREQHRSTAPSDDPAADYLDNRPGPGRRRRYNPLRPRRGET
jgi:hypothetical protein